MVTNQRWMEVVAAIFAAFVAGMIDIFLHHGDCCEISHVLPGMICAI